MSPQIGCRLWRLPYELRETIYIYYFNMTYGAKLDTKSDSILREPALTRTSKSLRAETLPVWYASQRLTMLTLIKRTPIGNNELTFEPRIWQTRLAPDKIRMLRRLKIIYHYRPHYGFGVSYVRIVFHVDLSKHSWRLSFSVEQRAWEGDITDFELDGVAEGWRLQKLLRDALQGFLDCPGGLENLTVNHLNRLAQIHLDAAPHHGSSGDVFRAKVWQWTT